MIPVSDIRAWSNVVPWVNEEQIEQDLVISRSLVEINCREHFTIMGFREIPFSIHSRWHTGSAIIHTYQLEELLGTKLRALSQRKKGRDLYDLYKAMTLSRVSSEKIIECYYEYVKFVVNDIPSRKQFIINLDKKMKDDDFIYDTSYLLRPTEIYQPEKAYEVIKEKLLKKL